MVTKHALRKATTPKSSVLAKIHMVTKLKVASALQAPCSVLAKIHMVTKLWSRRFR